ncbi:hypothetical protein GOAMR_60_00290 [Gordonia amarae NBRC 15530]|uniref:Uncharacterized protein n=2 Tax=Gordonia amarae TaxID=36821 RepID=G7GTH1_9ACTN|nr:hypothetical protein GOAMR_60_00290 [Gordonia amarae NBRC 15530]
MATHATTRHTQPGPSRPALAAGTAPVRVPHTTDFPVVTDKSIGNQCRITALTIVALLAVVIALALL